jgi:hypothetical protein
MRDPKHAEQMRQLVSRPASDDLEPFESRLRQAWRDAEESWMPGQAIGEILSYLDRVEFFTGSDLTASSVQRRMRWLTAVLRESVRRAQDIGLDPGRLTGIFSALSGHDALLSSERTVAGFSAKAARDLIRLEVAYLRVEQTRALGH